MKPLFRWAGGKRKMMKHHLPHMPDKFDIWVMAFLQIISQKNRSLNSR